MSCAPAQVPADYYGDSVVLGDLDAERAVRTLELTGPKAPMMTVVQLNHLGGALAVRPAVDNAVPYREAGFLLRLLSPLDGTDVASVRALYAEVAAVLAPLALGSFTELLLRRRGPHRRLPRREDTEEARRSGVASRPGEPLRRELRHQPRRPMSFQEAGSAPIASAAFSASPSRNGTR